MPRKPAKIKIQSWKNTDQPEDLVSSSTLASTSSKKRKSKDESLSSASKRAKTETDTIDLVKSCQSEAKGKMKWKTLIIMNR